MQIILFTRLRAAGWEHLLPAGCKFAVLYDGKPMVFDCPLKMKPSANSIYDLKDATASFFILVKNTDGGFLIGSFATGIRSLPHKPFDLLKKFLY